MQPRMSFCDDVTLTSFPSSESKMVSSQGWMEGEGEEKRKGGGVGDGLVEWKEG